MKQRVVMIGSGNVATAVAMAAVPECEIVQIYSRTLAHAQQLAEQVQCPNVTDQLNSLSADADVGFNITDNIGAFIETYNYLHPEEANQYMTEFGLTWMPSRKVQLDLECDLDFQSFGKHYVIGGGVAWMIN